MTHKAVPAVALLLVATLALGCKPKQDKPTPKTTPPAAAKKKAATSKPVAKKAAAAKPSPATQKTAAPKKAALPTDPRALRARAALMSYKMQLMGELKKAMKAGGFEKAIGVCKVQAPAVAKAIAKGQIAVGRTSHKLRNAKNAASEPWLQGLLDAYKTTREGQALAFKGLALKDGSYGYVQPIYLQGLCQSCHGKAQAIPPKVAALLKKLYPKDQATGFSAGDFRGLMWAKLSPAAAKKALAAVKKSGK